MICAEQFSEDELLGEVLGIQLRFRLAFRSQPCKVEKEARR